MGLFDLFKKKAAATEETQAEKAETTVKTETVTETATEAVTAAAVKPAEVKEGDFV